jgi:hypothetical protein
MSSSSLIRWGGLAAMVAGVLFIIVDLISLFVFGFSQRFTEAIISSGLLLFRSAVTPLAGALVLLGLVGLYARQSEAIGIPGLASFLIAFVGTVLAQGSILAALLADLGWALFGVASLQARVYPRMASILLIIGATSTGAFSALPRSEPGSLLMYAVMGADIILNAAIAWLGFSLFAKRRDKGRRQAS